MSNDITIDSVVFFFLKTVFARKDVLNGLFIPSHAYSSFAHQPGLHTIGIYFQLSLFASYYFKVLVDNS